MRIHEASKRFLRLAVGGLKQRVENRDDDLAAGRMEGAGPRFDLLAAPASLSVERARRSMASLVS